VLGRARARERPVRWWRSVSRPLVSDAVALSVEVARENGLLVPGARVAVQADAPDDAGASSHFTITRTESGLRFVDELGLGNDAVVTVEEQPMKIGGVRTWFWCPMVLCEKRTATLYLHAGFFACRRCHDLIYPSQRKNSNERLLTRLRQLRARLGWSDDVLAPHGDRPANMRVTTFTRLAMRHDSLLLRVMDRIESGR